MATVHLMNGNSLQPVKKTPFFTPDQAPPAGTARDLSTAPVLFQSLTLRGLSFQNRIIVSPMCQYSAEDGNITPWHVQHLSGLATRGPCLVITEVLSITPNGRVSPEDAGLWADSQMSAWKDVINYVHSQNSKIAVQIGHAGRKAGTLSPWQGRGQAAPKELGGWPDDVVGPSDEPYNEKTAKPRAMTLEDIDHFKKCWTASIRRAVEIGFDTINIHAAHGYLITEFLSPASNHRIDRYGGSFENRIRLLLEIVAITRDIIPDSMPLMVRLNATDYLEHIPTVPQWDIPQAVKLSKLLVKAGVDFIDMSGGANDSRQKIEVKPGYQIHSAKQIREAIAGSGAVVSGVGAIKSGKQASGYIESGEVDFVMAAKGFINDPNLVMYWADELNVPVHVASQYGWPFGNKRSEGYHQA